MEFGPRALGCRSIIGDPRSPTMQSTMNLKVKFRESFRPFAPSVLREHVHEYFQMRRGQDSPYMLLVAPVQEAQRLERTLMRARTWSGIEKLQVPRSTIPAVTHVDYSVRVQTVDAERHGRYFRLLQAFERQTGCPVLINTSFNVRGEPIVCRPVRGPSLLPGDQHGRAGPRELRAAARGAGAGAAGRRGRTPGAVRAGLEERLMALLEINRNPSRRDLAWFGAVLLLFFAVIGAIVGRALTSDVARNVLWGAGAVLALVYYAVPGLRRPMFVGWMYAAYPMGFIVSHLLLGLVYFGVVTPIGLLMRAVGHDPMARRFDRSAPTYWIAREPGSRREEILPAVLVKERTAWLIDRKSRRSSRAKRRRVNRGSLVNCGSSSRRTRNGG